MWSSSSFAYCIKSLANGCDDDFTVRIKVELVCRDVGAGKSCRAI